MRHRYAFDFCCSAISAVFAVLAIDLSLSSISYAKRKTRELGITNIEYAQADILKIGDIARDFYIIESGGVLHHLADPFMAGESDVPVAARSFMGLGSISELARRHVVKAGDFIGCSWLFERA